MSNSTQEISSVVPAAELGTSDRDLLSYLFDTDRPVSYFGKSCDAPTPDSYYKRRIQDAGCEPRRKRLRTRHPDDSSDDSKPLRLPSCDQNFVNFCHDPQILFVDKTSVFFQLPSHFRYLFLRPPRFGKTTLLSAMSQFYDIHGVDQFPEYFEAPDNARSDHSQHLCLCLKFSASRTSVKSDVFYSLHSFLLKYKTELGLSDPHAYLDRVEDDEPLKKVLDLVRSSGKTLFVTVDDYDAPLCESWLSCFEEDGTSVLPSDVAQLLDKHLWNPLKANSDIIPKLFVTGTLSLHTPVLRDLVVPAPDVLLWCCGFTGGEALRIAHKMLPYRTLILSQLKGRCGEYFFSCDGSISEPLLHPQILLSRFAYLSAPQSWTRQYEEDPFRLLTSLFDHLPSDSVDPNMVTLEGLVELISNGGVVDVEELDTGRDLEGTSVFWGALYHAGALTRCRGSRSILRVMNHQILHLIHSYIDKRVCGRYYGPWTAESNILGALERYDHGHPEILMDGLSNVLRDQMRRCFARGFGRQPSLPGIVQLIMRNDSLLTLQASRNLAPVILNSGDGSSVRVYGASTRRIYDWELTTLPLLGLWQAMHPTEPEPFLDALHEFFNELCEDDEARILVRPYRVWSDSHGGMKTALVGSLFKPDAEHTQLIAVGGARVVIRVSQAELAAVLPEPEMDSDHWSSWDDDTWREYRTHDPWRPHDFYCDYDDEVKEDRSGMPRPFTADDEDYFMGMEDDRCVQEEVDRLEDEQEDDDSGMPESFTPDEENYFMMEHDIFRPDDVDME